VHPLGSFPIEIFTLVDFSTAKLWTSTNCQVNTYICNTRNVSIVFYSALLKNKSKIGGYQLTDITAMDLQPMLNLVYNFVNLVTELRIVINTPILKNVNSISSVYSNSVWLERELSEMFDTTILKTIDSRRLLLDYTTSRGVLLKTMYNTTGVFYETSEYFVF
jgi:NADH:ubiquinone oxidoreductase subunit C